MKVFVILHIDSFGYSAVSPEGYKTRLEAERVIFETKQDDLKSEEDFVYQVEVDDAD